jgi:3-hydroxyisobutyrate dehydrogenase-like beta-hydroxyacid dehydrogenase
MIAVILDRVRSIFLPARLDDAGHQALQGQFTETNAAQVEAAHVTARTAAFAAAVPNLDCVFSMLLSINHRFLSHTS